MVDIPIGRRPIVVHGANGFLGRNLCLQVIESGRPLVAVARSFDDPFWSELAGNVSRIQADFADTRDLFDAVSSPEPCDHVLLVSASVPATFANDPEKEIQYNLLPHLRFIQDVPCSDRVLFVSSGGTVYGAVPGNKPITEDVAPQPISAYGLTKHSIEKYLSLVGRQRGLQYEIIRPGNPIGPWMNPLRMQGLVAVAMHRQLSGKTIEIWGDGTAVRDYLDVRDVIRAILMLLAREKLDNDVFNVGSGSGISIRVLLNGMQQWLDRPFDVTYRSARAIDVPYNVLDYGKLSTRVGWRPEIALPDSVIAAWKHLVDR